MKREYAEDMFYNGNLYFNYPVAWIKEAEKGNVGQGDLYEGVYTNVNNDYTRGLRPDAMAVSIDGRKFYRSPSVIENWPCLCFYSASQMTEGRKDEDGATIYDMAKDYVDSFSGGETFESMLKKPLNERMSMVVVEKIGTFLERLRVLFERHGLEEDEDFFIQPVRYRHGRKGFCIEKVPFELLSKEEQFKNQQEYRIILNPNNSKALELLEGGHKLHIDSMEDIAYLKTNFYEGASFKREDHRIIITYENWRNRVGPLNEWEFFSLVQIMPKLHHSAKLLLDGEVVSGERFWYEMVLLLCSKYNIELRHGDYDDGQDDNVFFIFHGDSMDTIEENERKDCYWYARKCTWTSPVFGGFIDESRGAKVNLLIPEEIDTKGVVTKFKQIVIVENG